jgi:tRNA threonylcarbamoyladenosine biosynthesis protein TsaE
VSIWLTRGEQETFDAGRELSRDLHGGELVLLEGELGLGKTVFARGLAAGLGIDPGEVHSPTFTLVHRHAAGGRTLFHVDLYRIAHTAELASLGLEEIFASGAVVVVEWGERLPAGERQRGLRVRFHDLGHDLRRIELSPPEHQSRR